MQLLLVYEFIAIGIAPDNIIVVVFYSMTTLFSNGLEERDTSSRAWYCPRRPQTGLTNPSLIPQLVIIDRPRWSF